jgi:hypothetical protein
MVEGTGFQGTLKHDNCKAELALKVIQGRWKLMILGGCSTACAASPTCSGPWPRSRAA